MAIANVNCVLSSNLFNKDSIVTDSTGSNKKDQHKLQNILLEFMNEMGNMQRLNALLIRVWGTHLSIINHEL